MIPSDASKKVLIIGQVFLDRYLDHQLVRLGGIFHMARALDALRTTYAAAYVCPSYLDGECKLFFQRQNASQFQKVGDVFGAPNIMEVAHSGESGPQLYRDLLRESRQVNLDLPAAREIIDRFAPTDILVSADIYDDALLPIIVGTNARVHVDIDHDNRDIWGEAETLTTVLGSTSGASFIESGRNPEQLREAWSSTAGGTLILKENRGGSRAWRRSGSPVVAEAPAYLSVTQHSVGVGDCFDAAWVSLPENEPIEDRLKAASYVASLYSKTFNHAEFIDDVHTSMKLRETLLGLEGVRIPWEKRPDFNIYLAAPDFPYVNRSRLEELHAAVLYHNFSARRPIAENGLATPDTSTADKRAIYFKDVELLEKCQLLVALPLVDDPGTFAELGWFSSEGKPTILYDPERRITNAFVSNAATRVCVTLTSVVDGIFELLGSIYGK